MADMEHNEHNASFELVKGTVISMGTEMFLKQASEVFREVADNHSPTVASL